MAAANVLLDCDTLSDVTLPLHILSPCAQTGFQSTSLIEELFILEVFAFVIPCSYNILSRLLMTVLFPYLYVRLNQTQRRTVAGDQEQTLYKVQSFF